MVRTWFNQNYAIIDRVWFIRCLHLSQNVGPLYEQETEPMIMGKVAMEARNVGQDGGYPVEEATLFVYCDKCGSFDIKVKVAARNGSGLSLLS